MMEKSGGKGISNLHYTLY